MLSAPEIWLSTESASHSCSEPSSPRTAAPLQRESNPLFKDLSLDDEYDASVAESKVEIELSDEQAKLCQPVVTNSNEGTANTQVNKGFASPHDGGKKTKSLSSMIRRLQVAERARQDRLQTHANARQYLSAQTVQSISAADGGIYSDESVNSSGDDGTRSLPLLNDTNGSFANNMAAESQEFIPFTMTSALGLEPYREGAKIDREQGGLQAPFHQFLTSKEKSYFSLLLPLFR